MPNQADEKNIRKGNDAGAWHSRKRSAVNRNGSNGEPSRQIERLIQRKKWQQARALLQDELVFAPADHWIWLTLGLTYYEQKQYEKALACSKRAIELEPNCPLALWHYAGCLFMTGQESSAYAIWSLLLSRDLEDIAEGECGEGMDWAMQLVNDVHFRLGRYFEWKNDPESARASYEKYLHNRAHGVGSIYDERQARLRIADIATNQARPA